MKRQSGRIDVLRPLAEKGLTLRDMASKTGWTKGAISGLLHRAGINVGKDRPDWVKKGDRKNPAWRRAADLYLQGKSPAEIAEAMGCDLEAAGRHLRRARSRGVAIPRRARAIPLPPPAVMRPVKRRKVATIPAGPPVSPLPDLEHEYARFGTQCQFIAGEPNSPQPFACSESRVIGRAYCDGHARLCRAPHPEAKP